MIIRPLSSNIYIFLANKYGNSCFFRLLEHHCVRKEAFLPSLYQDAERGHEMDGCHTGSHRQQDSHRNSNSAAHQRHQGKTHTETCPRQSSNSSSPEFNLMLFVFPQENSVNPDIVEQMYRRNPILRYTQHPLHSPLLPLPYGEVTSCEYNLNSATYSLK